MVAEYSKEPQIRNFTETDLDMDLEIIQGTGTKCIHEEKNHKRGPISFHKEEETISRGTILKITIGEIISKTTTEETISEIITDGNVILVIGTMNTKIEQIQQTKTFKTIF